MASCSANKLLSHYQFIGASPDDAVLAKSVELCISHRISEEHLVETWAAFAISHLKSAPPTLDGLELLERKELTKKNKGGATDDGIASSAKRSKTTSTPGSSRTFQQTTTTTQQASPALNETTFSQYVCDDVTMSQIPNYAERSNAGAVLLCNGTPEYSKCMLATSVKIHSGAPKVEAPRVPFKRRVVLADMMFVIATAIADKHGLVLPTVWDKKALEVTLFGKIVPMRKSGKRLTRQNIALELTSGFFANGELIKLNLTEMTTYSVFPGQVVVVEGKFEKEELKVAKLFTDALVPPQQQVDSGSLHIICAFGPFTLKDNLLYEPLQDLLRVVVKERPHVLILGGPFMDDEHPGLGAMTQDVDSHFGALIESIMTALEGCATQVVLVASHRDVHHWAIYPTPPFQVADQRIVCAPDPCLLDVAGMHIGITTVDAVFPIGKNEVVQPPGAPDRMSRLCNHLLSQRCFYPFQTDEMRSVPIDDAFMEQYGLMECVPHLFMAPSNFRYFIKEISGCTIVNPERLVKRGHVGGTYCRMQVTRTPETKVMVQVIHI